MSDEQTTCPRCGAPGELRSMIGPEMTAVTRMRWLCGSTNLEGREWPTEMCIYVASLLQASREQVQALRRERDDERRTVNQLANESRHASTVIERLEAENESMRRELDEAVELLRLARPFVPKGARVYRKEQQDGD